MLSKKHKIGLFFAIFGTALMSIESPLIKLSNLYWADASFLMGICLMVSTNALLIFKGKEFFIKSYKIGYKGVLLAGLCAGLSNSSFIPAVIYGGVANTVLILSTAPIVSAIIMWLFFKKATSKAIFVSTFFIFLGLYIILKDDLTSGTLIGTFLAFA